MKRIIKVETYQLPDERLQCVFTADQHPGFNGTFVEAFRHEGTKKEAMRLAAQHFSKALNVAKTDLLFVTPAFALP